MRVNCNVCSKEFYVKPNQLKKGFGKTCSRKCSGISKRTRVVISCSLCRKEFERRPDRLHERNYCSRICKEKDQCIGGPLALPHYKDGARFYRERAFRQYGKKCRFCGYDEDERMLDVHHIDGNREHNYFSNLEVLCVWCHALYTRKVIGRIVHSEERCSCKAEVVGAEPTTSTIFPV